MPRGDAQPSSTAPTGQALAPPPHVSSATSRIIQTINPFGGGAQPSAAAAPAEHGHGCFSMCYGGVAQPSSWGLPSPFGSLPMPFGMCPADPFTPPAITSAYEALQAKGKRVKNCGPPAGGGRAAASTQGLHRGSSEADGIDPAGSYAPRGPFVMPTPSTPSSSSASDPAELAAAMVAQARAAVSAATVPRKRTAEPGVERAPKNHFGAQRLLPSAFFVAEQERAPSAPMRPVPLKKKEPACTHCTEGVQGCRYCAASGLLSLFDAPSSCGGGADGGPSGRETSGRLVGDANYVSPLAPPPAFDVPAPDSPPSKTALPFSQRGAPSAFTIVYCKGSANAA